MKRTMTYRKKIAAGLLFLISANLLLPPVCLALTSGPTQPEARAFQPAGVSDMVDLFTGDFKYNIPLLDVDGYPINLNYASGSGMDDEASWTGLGWNVNVGAINRQVRGIPDDMSGDITETHHYTKPKITVGGKLSAKVEVFGQGTSVGPKLNGTLSIGVFNDNYTGIGAEVGANAGLSGLNEGPFTAGLGLGVTSNTTSGVEVTPSMNLGIAMHMVDDYSAQAGLSASLGYNSRSGLKSLTLGSSFSVLIDMNTKAKDGTENVSSVGVHNGGSSFLSYNTEPISPSIQVPYRSTNGSFSVDVGGTGWAVFGGFGGSGYKSVREIISEKLTNPAYGFLYAERGKNQKDALMDFTREKDNPVLPESPNLAIPVHTPDLFSFTSQTGSGQFRLYRGGSGAFFDNETNDESGSSTFGADYGIGNIFHGGVTLFQQNTKNTARKWVSNNNYLSSGDFQDASFTSPNSQHVYFKLTGEKTAQDADIVSKLHDVQPLEVSISGKTANAAFTNAGLSKLQKQNRSVNQTVVSYLTADEASKAALDKTINSYTLNDAGSFQPPTNHKPVPQNTYARVDNDYHKKHHFSEMTVTDGSGKRQVYGLPVYNVKQTEYSFAIGVKNIDYSILAGTNNQVPLALNNPNTPSASINHTKGIDNYLHSQSQPAYASSFLLTAILSPDYVDRTGDGISDDDPGTAIKFNYSKLPNLFHWRTPFSGATLNRAMLADKDDDKASIVYGEKELWYTHSIESKTKIAYFITQDRRDAMGVTDFTGAASDTACRQRCLKEIRLYSKADLSKPIKVVKFEYTYELCRGVPNNADNVNGVTSSDPLLGGKLTLKKVYFEYANSPKGANYPYVFTYQNGVNGQAVNYGDLQTDRWGVFKSSGENLLPLKNDEFPYTNQDIQGNDPSVKARVDQNAALWHLSSIKLPTGGQINVDYESDDYAYVQDKRAMAMSGIESLIDGGGTDLDANSPSYLKDAKGFKVKIPNSAVTGDPTTWFKTNYLNGADYVYTKFLVKISTPNSSSGGPDYDYDFVPCYSKVKSVSIEGGFAKILLEDRSDGGVTANPIIFSAWQKMKDEYPRYAYSGFDKRTKDGQASVGVSDAVKAIISSIGNLSELTENFYQKAARKNYAAKMQLSQSFVKLVKFDGHKLGGGVRVKKIRISDSWQDMTGNGNLVNAQYGQAYDYTTVDNNMTISSGVAAYEPSVGNDENALKQPVPYVEKIKGSIDSFFDLEEPFGESFYPAPTVGYSMVKVTDLNKNGDPDPTLRTGYSVNEFYTAKDFPVRVTVMPLSQNENKPANKLSFLGATLIDERTMSQGYSIELNDMHGKMKATRTFNQSGAEIASTVYSYNADAVGADSYKLKNTVSIVNPDGTVSNNQVIGRDIDFFTDFREFETKNNGSSIDAGGDVFAAFFVFAVPHVPKYDNSEYKLFRSACAVKVSQYYGLIDKVVKTQNGSSIATQNLAYDGLTGVPLVTKTQNEFDKSIYSVSLPAYWIYKGMGPAYQNAGTLFSNFSTDANGGFVNYDSFLKAGDELVDLASGNKLWVIEDKAPTQSSATKKLVSNDGKLLSSFAAAGLVKLVRSGYRNILDADAETLVCLTNPIQGSQLKITAASDLSSFKVINASAKTFNQSWSVTPFGINTDNTRNENTNPGFTYGQAVTNSNHGYSGAYIYGAAPGTGGSISNAFLQAGLNRSGVWPNPQDSLLLNAPAGFQKDITITTAKTYYIGYSGDNDYQYTVDNVALPATKDALYWSVYPMFLSAGTHHLSFQATNIPRGDGLDNTENNPGAIGMEIYDCTEAQLNSGSSLTTVFSTVNVIGDSNLDSFLTIGGTRVDHFFYTGTVNPYTAGFLGNWREHNSLVFQQSRYTNPATPDKGLDVKNAGTINNFFAYWFYGTRPGGQPGWTTDATVNRARWVTANTVTAYDKYGQQLENKDALGRFSAAKFDFNGELPAGVASNSRNREMYVNSFEDQLFNPGTVAGGTVTDFVQPSTGAALKQFIVSTNAHSGNYSVLLPADGLQLRTNIHSQELGTDGLLLVNANGEFNIQKVIGLYPNGFEPYPYKKYIFNVWVSDGHPNDKSVNLSVSTGTGSVTLLCKAVVEGWKLLEGTIDLSASPAGVFTLTIAPAAGSVYIDDLRIHPFDAHLKSYVYDDKTMRLMAEIDENGFATFYEYDDEGLLIRVKKETERGVMTIKESRSSYRKSAL